ncbi:MAG: hypothetical protein AB1Z98_40435 [Nannocystaceae bacterium]
MVEGDGRDRDQALELADDALRTYQALGSAHADDALRVQRWLDAHRGG